MAGTIRHGVSPITDYDIFLFKQGTHYHLYEKMGAQKFVDPSDNTEGVAFSVWAPNAQSVSVVGNFNDWNTESHPLAARWDGSGIWEGFVPGLQKWELYKFCIRNSHGEVKEKMDPFCRAFELPPRTSSITHWPEYEWGDSEWLANRGDKMNLSAPLSVYEVHMGSWRRHWDDGLSLSYREMAEELPAYCEDLGFNAVEFLPIMEHPFYGSWGYQTLGYFAPTARYGTPEDLMYLIDSLHKKNIAVILDFVPSHFPTDDFGLARYDGTALYEHEDPRKGYHPDWGSYIFNYGRNEVRSYLISSAAFWIDQYHADGLRIDAVASMLYLDYSRKNGEWIPNIYGGRENLEAISLLRDMNSELFGRFGNIQTIAEESTDWPMVTRPVFLGGLGFGMKWNMGWMHDTLEYMSLDPIYRQYHHSEMTFSMIYAYDENFILSISHDEVVHGKHSLLYKMPGDEWQQAANLRAYLAYMYAHPGKKLNFMGTEFAQTAEWNHDGQLQWWLEQFDKHKGVKKLVQDLNKIYKSEPALYEADYDKQGFEWLDYGDYQRSIFALVRFDKKRSNMVISVSNMTPTPREGYRIGVHEPGKYHIFFNTDSQFYWGSDYGTGPDVIVSENIESQGKPQSICFNLPPLCTVYLKKVED